MVSRDDYDSGDVPETGEAHISCVSLGRLHTRVVLLGESTVKAKRGAGCKIITGKWVSWYDGRTWTRPSDVDIDHMVPLKEAWDSGARLWSATDRMRYANDLSFASTLVAATDNVNASKGERDPADWMPSKARCRYATQWVTVKYRWQLSLDRREKNKLSPILKGACGSKRLTLPASRPRRAPCAPFRPRPLSATAARAC
jgi:hypothetical protein